MPVVSETDRRLPDCDSAPIALDPFAVPLVDASTGMTLEDDRLIADFSRALDTRAVSDSDRNRDSRSLIIVTQAWYPYFA